MASQAEVFFGNDPGREILNIWTVFFLVVSAVVLTAPLLSTRNADRIGSASILDNTWQDWEEDELELDLVSGHIARDDYEAMTARRAARGIPRADRAKRDDGNLSEG
jgi:hypothetical protein